MKLNPSSALLASLLLCLASAQAARPAAKNAKPAAAPLKTLESALRNIDGDNVLEHIKMLASDEFEGRAPGTRGEALTIDYLQQQFKKLGLEPGNPDGTYLQPVPLVGISSHATLSYAAPGAEATPLRQGDDFVAWTARTDKKIDIVNSDLVFVGYGINAPEFRWDDYKGVDVRGKTLLMLINDPPLPDPKNPKQLDPAMFGGNAMSYYGRWTYKFEMAARLGAAAALIVHETKPAAYPYEVVRNSWGHENFAIKSTTPNGDLPAVPGWLQLDRAREIFKAGGVDFDWVKKAALSRDFRPVQLGVKISISEQNAWRDVASNNVVAKIPGADPLLKNEVIVYTAHWDHFGVDDTLPGPRSQQVFHGALDNASGVAALLEIARTYKALPAPPKRTIVFVLTTGEERGLLGAQYYARHPLYPLSKTLLNINLDGINVWGRARDVAICGMGKSNADEIVASVARAQGRVVRPDNNAESGSFFRGDQFEFAKAGVPVVYLSDSVDYIGKPAAFGRNKLQEYTARRYHTVNDVVEKGWDMSGAEQDIELLFKVGYQVAQGKDYPQWKDGAEFKAVREQSLNGRGSR